MKQDQNADMALANNADIDGWRRIMTEIRLSLTKTSGWTRLGLPLALFMLLVTPMLWSLGVFESTTEPLLHALIFAGCGMTLCGATPLLTGWALQGFVIRRKSPDESDEPAASARSAPMRPKIG